MLDAYPKGVCYIMVLVAAVEGRLRVGDGRGCRRSTAIWTDWMYSRFRCVTGTYATGMDWIDQVLSYICYALSTPSNRIFGYLKNPSLPPHQNQNQDKAMQHTR